MEKQRQWMYTTENPDYTQRRELAGCWSSIKTHILTLGKKTAVVVVHDPGIEPHKQLKETVEVDRR